jgi:hypothetical protein
MTDPDRIPLGVGAKLAREAYDKLSPQEHLELMREVYGGRLVCGCTGNCAAIKAPLLGDWSPGPDAKKADTPEDSSTAPLLADRSPDNPDTKKSDTEEEPSKEKK